MYCVYVIYSDSTGKFYTGQCKDIEQRLLRHNAGETRSIRHGIPWRLVWMSECETRGEAMKLENKIKKRGAKRFLEDINISLV